MTNTTKSTTVFNIMHNAGYISGIDDRLNYDSKEEAVESIRKFKENPLAKHPYMDKESVEYWKKQEFKVVKVYTVKETVEII